MKLYVIRLRNGNCVVTAAEHEAEAGEKARGLGSNSEIASIRELGAFAAHFVLSDAGELTATLLDTATRAELLQHEYPMLRAAEDHSFTDFGRSQNQNSPTDNLYSRARVSHEAQWPKRDADIIRYAVKQERLRFSN